MQLGVEVSELQAGLVRQLSIGSVLSATLAVWRRNLPFYVGLAVLVYVPGLVVASIGILQGELGRSGLVLMGILDFLGRYAAIGLATTSVLDQLRGRRPSVRRSLSQGASRFGSLVSWGFSTEFFVATLFILLVVPGLIAIVRWILVAPIVVAEPDADARARSASLTAGHRWMLFGLVVLLYGTMFVSWLVEAAVLGPSATLLNTAIRTLSDGLILSVQAVLLGVLYERLRSPDAETLAAVFE